MALVNGALVIPAGSFNGTGRVADLTKGTLCPEGLNVGVWHGDATDKAVFNNGLSTINDGAVNPVNLRKVTGYSGTTLLGKVVRLTGAGPAFQGVVVQQLNTELSDTNGDGVQVPVVVVKAAGFYYVAEPANVEEV